MEDFLQRLQLLRFRKRRLKSKMGYHRRAVKSKARTWVAFTHEPICRLFSSFKRFA